MGRFDVFTEQVKIEHNDGETHTYTLRPLKGMHLQNFYGAVKGLQNLEEGDMSNLDEESMAKLHDVAVKCLEQDASGIDEDKLDRFVSQHLMQLVEPVMKVNLDVDEDELDIPEQ